MGRDEIVLQNESIFINTHILVIQRYTNIEAIPLDKETSQDLLNSKLDDIESEIESILSTWKENDPAAFIGKTKSGKYAEESVQDGIAIRQLLSDKEKYESLLKGTME